MKTIGQHLRDIRKIRKKSIEDLANQTKIKTKFIHLIEDEEWGKLPEYPVVLGFVKSISNALDINTQSIVALLKRDYPPQKLTVNPRPEIKEEFSWGPRLTFLAGVTAVLIMVIAYLIFQYFRFLAPPSLKIERPSEGQIISDPVVEIAGKTNSDVSVIVNDQPAFVDEEGNFYTEIEATESLSQIEVIATSRSGQETKEVISISIIGEEE